MKRFILPNGNVVSEDYLKKNVQPSEESRSCSFIGYSYMSDIYMEGF
jgi:hypothetical protein